MARRRRFIETGKPYELIIRVKEGLPFRPGPLINAILLGSIARAQRDNKVTLCHFLWMSNHLHMIFIPHSPLACVHLYQEIQKKITDAFKRLLGKRRLSLWEGDPVLAQILDLESAIDRVAYLYANPAKANLVDSINDYPGASSWTQFTSDKLEVDLPWLQLPTLSRLPSLALTQASERSLLCSAKKKASLSHTLVLNPAALVFALGASHDCKDEIIKRTSEKELLARTLRTQHKKSLLSRARLITQKILQHHIPARKPSARRVFVLTSCPSLRAQFIAAMNIFAARCSLCYKKAIKGISTLWPSHAFIPSLPPRSG